MQIIVITALAAACLGQTTDTLPAPTGEAIVAPDAKLERLFTRTAPIQGGLTEGPAAAPDGSIFFSDIPMGPDKGMILRFDPRTKTTQVFAADSHKSNGLAFDPAGNLIACEGADGGGRGLARWNIQTGERTVLVDRFDGKRFNAPNDLVIDRRGRVYFTDPKYVGTESRELEYRSVYRFDPAGEVIEITHDVSKPNGIALSPDNRTLYVVEHDNGTDKIGSPDTKPGLMRILAFPLDADGTVNGPRRVLIDFGPAKGCDGMTVDAAGNLYFASRNVRRPGVLVTDPDGKEIAFIPTGPAHQAEAGPSGPEPVGLPSNVEFGRGDESNMLYVTVDRSLYRIPLRGLGRREGGK